MDSLLGPTTDERFAALVALGKMITDYAPTEAVSCWLAWMQAVHWACAAAWMQGALGLCRCCTQSGMAAVCPVPAGLMQPPLLPPPTCPPAACIRRRCCPTTCLPCPADPSTPAAS